MNYSKGNREYKDSYDESGKLLETVEIVHWNKLPKYVKKSILSRSYNRWTYEKGIEKVESNYGNTVYKLYTNENGNSQILVISKQ